MKAERICGYPVHPAARMLPLASEAEVAELAAQIKANGQRHKAVLLDGQLLDGRNRGRACQLLGLKLETRPATPEETAEPFTAVADWNLHRRHLTESQRALVAVELLPELAAEAKARQAAALKKGPSAPQGADGKKGKAAAQAAKAIGGVSSRQVERAKFVVERAPPELVESVRRGAVTVKQAERQLRKADQLEQVRKYLPPTGEYAVIAVDPSWPYEDELDGSDRVRGALPYPPMTIEEICALKIPAAKDCILWLWTTGTHLVNGNVARVLEAWGFTGKPPWTWDKVDMGNGSWGRAVTEFVVVAVRGHPVGDFGAVKNLFREKRSRVHSRKPEKFYRIVEQTCPCAPGARLEMFARQRRRGWVTTGAELPAAAVDYAAASLEAYRRGEDLCSGCGRARPKRRNPKAKAGWVHMPLALPLCWDCHRAKVAHTPVAEADHEARFGKAPPRKRAG